MCDVMIYISQVLPSDGGGDRDYLQRVDVDGNYLLGYRV
jgi:hypothetical protein